MYRIYHEESKISKMQCPYSALLDTRVVLMNFYKVKKWVCLKMVVFLTIPNLGHFNDHTWWWSRFTGFHCVSYVQTTHMNMPSPCLNLLLHQIDHYENVAGLKVLCQPTHIKSVDGTRCPILWESDYKWMLLYRCISLTQLGAIDHTSWSSTLGLRYTPNE